MFQQHHGESLSEAWTHFKVLLQKFPHHGIDIWLQIQNFYDQVSFLLKREIDHAAGGKLRDKNAEESWEIIENLAMTATVGMTQGISLNCLLKELRKGKSPEKVLVREEVYKPITKYVNTVSLVITENEKDKGGDEVVDKSIVDPIEPIKNDEAIDDVMNNVSNRSMNKGPTRWGKYEDRLMKMPMSQLIGYYLKHEINEKIIEGLVDNHKYNDSLLATRLGKMSNKTYNSLPVGPMYTAILKKKLARKEKRGYNFVIPYSIWRLKFINALADQGSNVNIMLLSIYDKLTIKKPVGTNIRLYLANHSYDYPLEIAEDVLIDVAGFVYPVDFFILDIKGNEHMPLILGTPFLTTASAEIEFDNVTPRKFQVIV
ncbi:MAK10-like protein [Tanacetum coccineum]